MVGFSASGALSLTSTGTCKANDSKLMSESKVKSELFGIFSPSHFYAPSIVRNRERDGLGRRTARPAEDEVAFYDALEVNDSAVAVLGDDTSRLIAQELVRAVRNSVTIDWSVRENVRANMRVIIKRILKIRLSAR
jgi:Domain of unknown function (DUF3387)